MYSNHEKDLVNHCILTYSQIEFVVIVLHFRVKAVTSNVKLFVLYSDIYEYRRTQNRTCTLEVCTKEFLKFWLKFGECYEGVLVKVKCNDANDGQNNFHMST